MPRFILRLFSLQPFRYIFIGGLSYVVELAVLLSLANLLHFSSSLSVACSFWIGLVVSFLLQKYIAFSNTSSDKRTVGRQSLLYGALVLFNYFFTIFVVDLLASGGDNYRLVIVRTAALIATTFWNYFVYKRIFAKSQS